TPFFFENNRPDLKNRARNPRRGATTRKGDRSNLWKEGLAVRLTLRTLLAYLDDTLEPAQAKLIGQKVAESDTAQELIERIKQVTRTRRLTAPPATGAGGKIDPNTIAEYLDNAVTAEQSAEVEQICLASDVHLAEVAACHQIPTP